jgi:GNAT superfamily N-acetyltransferase
MAWQTTREGAAESSEMNINPTFAEPRPRPTVPDDVPQILALIGEIFQEYGCQLDAENEDTHLLDPGPYFRARGGEFWVVEVHEVVRATAAVFLHETAGELKCLYVHPTLRRMGWGRRLVELAMDWARRAGRRQFILWSDTRFVQAHALYRRLGFREFGVRELHDSNHSRETAFECDLTAS